MIQSFADKDTERLWNRERIPPGNRLEALKGDRRGQRRLRSLTTTDKLPPVHPGEILMEDFLKGMGITQHKLAVSIGVPPRRINEIVHGKRAVTADTALRLAKFFEMSPQFWLGLQAQYDLDGAEDRIRSEIERIQPVQAVSA